MYGLTVLVPLDGSKHAEGALAFLTALKPLGLARVRLVHVVENDVGVSEEHRDQMAAEYLPQIAARVHSQQDVEVDCEQRKGQAYREILEEAARPDVNLLLMATHGRTSFDLDHLGSVADKVVRGASCPTLLVGPHASVPLRIEKVTVPLDGSRIAEEALPVAKRVADRLGSRLRIVRAVQTAVSMDTDAIGGIASDVVESAELTAGLYLSEATLELETKAAVETAVLHGPPARALLADLKENPPDLVIMTSHGRTGFVRWALGSVTDRLIRGSVPVLVVRPSVAVTDRLAPPAQL